MKSLTQGHAREICPRLRFTLWISLWIFLVFPGITDDNNDCASILSDLFGKVVRPHFVSDFVIQGGSVKRDVLNQKLDYVSQYLIGSKNSKTSDLYQGSRIRNFGFLLKYDDCEREFWFSMFRISFVHDWIKQQILALASLLKSSHTACCEN